MCVGILKLKVAGISNDIIINFSYGKTTQAKEVFDYIDGLSEDIKGCYRIQWNTEEGASYLAPYDCLFSYFPDKEQLMYLVIKTAGGGKGVQKKTKEKKLQLVEKLKKDMMEASQTINNDNIKNLEPVKAVEKKIADMMNAPDCVKALKELALSCDSKEKLDECIALLDRSDKSAQVCNTVEGRLKRVSKILFGRDGSQIIEMKEQIDHITDAMNSSLQFLYMKTDDQCII